MNRRQTCPRTCSECDGTHHWIVTTDDEWDDEPIMSCKHCPTQRQLEDDEDPDRPFETVITLGEPM